jgi:hypothetical protein
VFAPHAHFRLKHQLEFTSFDLRRFLARAEKEGERYYSRLVSAPSGLSCPE